MDFTKNMVVDVYTAYFYIDDALVYTSKNLVKSSKDTKTTIDEVRNGAGNQLFSILNSGKSVDVTLTENTFNFDTVAMLTGSKIVTGAGKGYSQEVDLVADATKAITLPIAPVAGAVLTMFCNGIEVTGTLADLKVTFSTGVNSGDTVKVYPYQIATGASSQIITINANKFPSGGTLVLKTKEVSADKKVIASISIICENAIPTGDWKLDTTSKVQANESDITMKICAYNDNGDMYRIVREPVV